MTDSKRELALTRIYDAPVKAVWDAWTDPKQVAQWWGPRGFTLTTHSKELKPGGTWRYTMHSPDGTDYPNVTKYLEVEKYSRLVYDHGGTDETPPLFRVTVVFSETRGKTKMEMRMILPTPEAAEEARKFIKKAGGDSTWDRLAEYLEKESSGKEKFVINRAFEAPLQTMFQMWTDPKHFSRWLPPAGFTMEFIRADIRTGGSSFYLMTNGADVKMYGKVKYLEITDPNRVVYTQQFCDEREKVSRHPMMPTWPETMLTTVALTDEGPGRTRVTVTWEPYESATSDELEAFIKMRGGMTQGWTGSFDKLEALLSSDRIEKQIELKATVSNVWKALTDYRQFGEWFRVRLEGPFVVGQPARGNITHPGYEHCKWEAVVQKMEPEHYFSFIWHPYAIDQSRDYSEETPTLVEFKLEKTSGGARLTLIESGFDEVPADRRDEAFRMNSQGWAAQMENIERYVEQTS